MTIDLWMLVWTALLCSMMPAAYLIGRLQVPGGMEWGLGNREMPLEVPAWAARAERAHANLVENLPVFAVLVLVAHIAGQADALTATGATLFFLARVAHAVVYTAGITTIRTVMFFVGLAGELLILVGILR